jgi:hypothetical protein
VARANVCATLARFDDPRCPRVGWRTWLDTRRLSPGRHRLTVVATDGLARRTQAEILVVVEATP